MHFCERECQHNFQLNLHCPFRRRIHLQLSFHLWTGRLHEGKVVDLKYTTLSNRTKGTILSENTIWSGSDVEPTTETNVVDENLNDNEVANVQTSVIPKLSVRHLTSHAIEVRRNQLVESALQLGLLKKKL